MPCVELLRGVSTSLKCVLTASASFTAAKVVNQQGWEQHKTVFDAITQLKVDRKANVYKTDIYNKTLPSSEQDQVVQLIGEICQVACKINVATQVLPDTGAQMSLLSYK